MLATSEAVRVREVAKESLCFGLGKDAFGCNDGPSGQHNDELYASSVAVASGTRVVISDGGAGKASPLTPPPPSLGHNGERKGLPTKSRGASDVFDGVGDSKRRQGRPCDGPMIMKGVNDQKDVPFRGRPSSPTNAASRRRRQRGRRGVEKALKLVTRCLQMDALNAKAYALRAELEARLGRRDRAITDFRAAASLEHAGSRSKINQVGGFTCHVTIARQYI